MATSVAGAAAVNPNDIKTYFINGNPTFDNGPVSLRKNSPDCTILDSSVFDNFILAD